MRQFYRGREQGTTDYELCPAAVIGNWPITENHAEGRDAALGKLHGGDVKAVYGEDGVGSAEVALSDMDCDFAFLAGEQGDVVVVEEDGEDFGAVFSFEQAEANEEGEAGAGVFDITWAAVSWPASETVIEALTVALGRSWRARKSAYSVSGV